MRTMVKQAYYQPSPLLYVFTMFHHLWISKWYIKEIMIIKTYELQLHCLWSILWLLIYVYQDFSSMNFFFHIGCIDMVSPQYESSYACQDYLSLKMLYHTGCSDMVSPEYVLSYAGQDYFSMEMLHYTGCTDMISPQYESS